MHARVMNMEMNVGRNLTLQLIESDLVASAGARCMDGTPGGFYFAPAATAINESRLVLHLEGGGECRSAKACSTWAFHSGSSTTWPKRKATNDGSHMDASVEVNPDFHDWAKLFIPFCSADLHAGTRTDRSAALGGWYFAGHNLLAAALTQLRRTWPSFEPSTVLVTGSSAGGIGALLHADWLAEHWPRAMLKVSPAAGLFYPPVNSLPDALRRRQTPSAAMAMHEEWRPFLHTRCAKDTNGSVAACSNAHVLLRYVTTPLYIRENLFDIAKLANCGLDVHTRLTGRALDYLKEWGRQTRRSLEALRSRGGAHGVFAPSCLAHASNLRYASAPSVGGVRLLDSMRAWFFGASVGGKAPASPLAEAARRGSHPDHQPTRSLQYLMDECGDLPCSSRWDERSCPHLDSMKQCNSRCRSKRRRRRIRLGLDPSVTGHNVCALDTRSEV